MQNNKKLYKYKYADYGLVSVKSMISKTYLTKLREYSKALKVPMSLLIARAIKNEFNCENSFEAPIFDIPKLKPFSDETAPTIYTQKLYNFIQKYPGMSIEQLSMCREEIEIPSDDLFVLSYGVLLANEMIIEEYPIRAKFNYPDEHRTVKIKQDKRLIRDKGRVYKELDYQKSPLHEVDDHE